MEKIYNIGARSWPFPMSAVRNLLVLWMPILIGTAPPLRCSQSGCDVTCLYALKSNRMLVTVLFLHLLSTPMGEDSVVIGFDMEVQPLVTHNAA